MNESEARAFVENLLDRLEQDGAKYRLPSATLTAREVSAFRILARLNDVDEAGEDSQLNADFELNLDCLSKACDEDKILCVDFGTAFSKAALWDQWDVDPIPLPVGQGISADPLLIDSLVYIGAKKLFFGPSAMQKYLADGNDDRSLFTSPKEILNLDYETIETDRPSLSVDPHKMFKKKELLVLFLGFLTALTTRELIAIGITQPIKRRFAAPGWDDAQDAVGGETFDKLVPKMRRFLAEAQILADSFEISAWTDGVEIDQAKSAIGQLNQISDDELLGAPFIERPVLEVTAAASSVKEKLLNKRPQVVLVDIGAGTTDIGIFKYVGSEDEPKFAAYKNGMGALRIAGNRLDDAFKRLVRQRLQLGDDSTAKPRLERELVQNIHRYKQELFSNGAVVVSVTGLPDVKIKQAEFVETPEVSNYQNKFRDKIVKLLNVADGAGGASFTGATSENVVVFTGGGGGLPFLHEVFDRGLDLETGNAVFEEIEPRPGWLDNKTEAVQLIFPQIAVAVGGASPDLPKVLPTVGDTSSAGAMSLSPNYKS